MKTRHYFVYLTFHIYVQYMEKKTAFENPFFAANKKDFQTAFLHNNDYINITML